MRTTGPTNARIMIVGEAPGERDLLSGEIELNKMLQEAGIVRNACFVTNVCNERPPENDMGQWLVDLKKAPDPANAKYKNKRWVPWRGKWAHPAVAEGYEQLAKHIALVRPALVLALGNTALFALTGKWGISKWRGSQLTGSLGGHDFKVIPAYHPSAIQRDWSVRPITVHDFRRAAGEAGKPLPYIRPNFARIIRPTFAQAVKWLGQLRMRLAAGPTLASTDIETRAGMISCTGIHVRGLPTICIPWMCFERPEGYWDAEEERFLWRELNKLISHPNYLVVGQNWFYDAQYKYRFHFLRKLAHWDTMIAQHCIYPGQPKGLDYLASIYNDFYIYWKDDGKLVDPSIPEDTNWAYNCDDTENTMEVAEKQMAIYAKDERLQRVRDFQNNRLGPMVFKAMTRGIKADTKNKARLSKELDHELKIRQARIDNIAGHPLSPNSPAALQRFFYHDLQIPPVTKTKGKDRGKITTDDDALKTIAKRMPTIRGLCRLMQEYRSIRVFRSTFVEARLDRDQRIRCSFNIGGTVTFRLSSSENAFGSGLNLQNISMGGEEDGLELPNIRMLFIPDTGMVIFDMDLRNADFYSVVWEANDEFFRKMLELGVDQHLANAAMLFPSAAECTLERLTDPEFVKYAKKKYHKERDFGKRWVHGTDYGGGDRTMAATVGITVAENKKLRERWFGEHPGIKAWHKRTEDQINAHRYVENPFGYRWTIFDRLEGILPEAIAWVPQCNTGCIINRIWDRIDREIPEVEVLIQVHDSLVGQFPIAATERVLPALQECSKIVVPYSKPLVIPVGMKTSELSWGHCD